MRERYEKILEENRRLQFQVMQLSMMQGRPFLPGSEQNNTFEDAYTGGYEVPYTDL
jgi:hypothetical protein